jgi:hypothetical protein
MIMQTPVNLQITKKEVPPEWLSVAASFTLLPLDIELMMAHKAVRERRADAIARISFDGITNIFLVEYRAAWNHRTFLAAVETVERSLTEGQEEGDRIYPMIILPYLSDEHLLELANRRISGLDLCGNGIVIVPGQWFIHRSGQPNRYHTPQSLQNPYKGRASLVARMLLRRPRFRRLEDLHTEIEQRGGTLSLALVSRAIQRLEEELILIPESGTRVRLVQPEKLLKRLQGESVPPRITHTWQGRIGIPTRELLPMLFQIAADKNISIAMTGIGSAAHYTNINAGDISRIYADNIDLLLLSLPVKPGERFANLEIQVPHDPVVYFDTERDAQGVVWASPIQTYLEMTQSGDARLEDSADSLRKDILSAVMPAKETQ